MKRNILRIFIPLLVCIMALFTACQGKEGSPSFVLAETNYWLDRYEELDVKLTEGDAALLEWESADESVVTAEKGRLIAQGVGATTVTVSDGDFSQEISVRVRNSGVKPKIGFDEFDAYMGVATQIPNTLNYAGKDMNVDIVWSLQLSDPSYLKVEGNSVTGLKLGVVQGVISSEWKGLQLSKEITINVLNPLRIELEEEEITLYNVNSKLGKADLGVHVYNLTEELIGAEVQYSIVSGEEFIRIENGVVYAKGVGEAEVLVSYSTEAATIRIVVNPEYVQTAFKKPSSPYTITWAPYEGEIGGKKSEEMYEYCAGEDVDSSNCFDHRVVVENDEDVILELYREGYRYFAYDLYYTSNQSLMVGAHNLTSWISVGDYFRRDYMMITADGEVINRLEKDRWITVIYDLRALWDWSFNLPSNFFFFVNDASTSQYIMNARYYLDSSFIPDENLEYEDKGEYVQATNDEFDVRVPVSKSYSMETGLPSVMVTKDSVPLYGAYDGEIDGRTGVYRYETRSAGSITNSLVIAKSLNQTYDDGMYQMSKLGSYLAYDIYPEEDCTLTFRMNGESVAATVMTDKTNVAQYENWLIVLRDGKKQSTIVAGEWQTIVIAFVDNYDEDCMYSGISFSAEGDNDVVYVDNVRYYKTENFLPTAYAEDKNGPYQAQANADVTLQKAETGSFKGAYEYVNRTDGESGAISFKGVTAANNTADVFFYEGYKYVRFSMYLAENITSLTLKSVAERNFENYNVTLRVGETFDESVAAIFNENGRVVTCLETQTWYNFYIPVQYTSTDVGNTFVGIWTNNGNNAAGAKAYIRYVSFEYAVRTPYVRTSASISNYLSLEWQNEGEYVGSWKYVNKTSGEVGNGVIDWGNSGVSFSDVHDPVNAKEGAFFKDGYQWIKVDFCMTESVDSFNIRFSAGKTNAYWVRKIPFNQMIGENVYALNEDGERINVLNYNEWFTLYIPVQQTSIDDNWYIVTVYTNGGTEDDPSIAYVKNVVYLKEWNIPEYPEYATTPIELIPTLTTWSSEWTTQVTIEETVFQDETVWQYVNNHGGRNGAETKYGDAGLFFAEVNCQGSSRLFFKAGYRYIKLDFYVAEGVESIDFRCDTAWRVDHNVWEEYVIGYTFHEDFQNSQTWAFYDEDGQRVTKLEHNRWYTLVLCPIAEANQICIQVNGETSDTSAPTIYLRDAVYEKEQAKEA